MKGRVVWNQVTARVARAPHHKLRAPARCSLHSDPLKADGPSQYAGTVCFTPYGSAAGLRGYLHRPRMHRSAVTKCAYHCETGTARS